MVGYEIEWRWRQINWVHTAHKNGQYLLLAYEPEHRTENVILLQIILLLLFNGERIAKTWGKKLEWKTTFQFYRKNEEALLAVPT